MQRADKNTIVKGALILIIGNIIVKVIGAGFKIPLTWMLGASGMALFGAAFDLYAILFTIATAGFPIAMSKMVAESAAKGNEREAKRIFASALLILGVIGSLGTIGLYFGANRIAEMTQSPMRAPAIMAISPAVLFVAISCSFRGYFQGKQNMLPTALSNIMEALGKLLVGLALAFFMLKFGIEFGAAGAAYGVGFGTALSALLLFCFYVFNKSPKTGAKSRSFGRITLTLFAIALPVTLGACVQGITNVIDTLTIVSRLQTIPGIDLPTADVLFGILKGYVLPIQGLPLALVVGISTAIVPGVSAALAIGDRRASERITQSVIRITTLFALPCAVGIWALSEPIMQTIFGSTYNEAPVLLGILSVSILFSSLLAVTNAILQANGRMYLPVIFMGIGGVVKLAINYFCIPIYSIFAAGVSTNVCYVLIVTLNLIAIVRVTKIKFNLGDLIVRPLIASAALAVTAIFVWSSLVKLGVGNMISTGIAIFSAGVVYIIVLISVRGLKEEDVRMLPKGEKIAGFIFK